MCIINLEVAETVLSSNVLISVSVYYSRSVNAASGNVYFTVMYIIHGCG